MSCPKCGSPTSPEQNFCSNCGFDLRGTGSGAELTPDRYTPSHLAERILADRHALVGERKQVTVMFADIVDSTAAIQGADPEEAAGFLTSALEAMMTAIHQFEGTVNELRGDGLMALFGAPIAHEDHAVRAARAALAIPETVAEATEGRARTRVGIHSGEVLVRGVGNDLSIEYQALGPTVHIAARMESLAEAGTAYVTRETRDLIEGRVETSHVGAMTVKGVADPLDVYELSEVVERTPWEARATRGLTLFTGRDPEMAVLRNVIGASESGTGGVVDLRGGAGVGKSRLVHELLTTIDPESHAVLRANASPYEAKTAYYPIRRLLTGWLEGISGSDPDMRDLEVALSNISPDLSQRLPVFGSLLNLGGHLEWDDLPGPRRRAETREAIRLAVSALAERRPVVVILEDLHWIDSETEGVIEEVVEMAASKPIAMILTFRPEFESPWSGAKHVKTLDLTPLGEPDSIAFLDCLLGDHESVARIKPLMAQRAEGIPLFMEEMVRSMADSGVLDGTQGSYIATQSPGEVEIPTSVHSVVAARIDRLHEDDKTVLQVAALVGDTVPVVLAGRLLHRTEESTLRSLRRLADGDFLVEQSPLPDTDFRFTHALIREVAYGSLPISERRSMHAEMVAVIEDEHGDTPVERLSYHAIRGEMWREAVAYSLRAADKAISKSAFREASSFLRDATTALSELPESDEVIELAIDTRMKLRVAETGAQGGLNRLISDLDEAAMLADAHEDESRRARVAIHAGYTANMLGDASGADHHSRVALETAKKIGDETVIMESQLLLAQSLLYSGRYASVTDTLDPFIERLVGDLRHQTMDQTMIRSVVACAHYAVANAGRGSQQEADKWMDTAQAIAEEASRPFDLMYSYFARGKCLSFRRSHDAVAAHETSVRVADENGLWFMKTFAQPWHAHALMREGRIGPAMSLLRSTEAAAKRVDLPFTEAEAKAFAAVAMRIQGDDPTIDAEFAIEFGVAHANPILEVLGRIAIGEDPLAASLAAENGLSIWASEIEAGTWLDPN